jgi:hypothetical protein
MSLLHVLIQMVRLLINKLSETEQQQLEQQKRVLIGILITETYLLFQAYSVAKKFSTVEMNPFLIPITRTENGCGSF